MNGKYIIALLKCKGVGNAKLFEYIKKQNFNIDNIKKNIDELICCDDLEIFEHILTKAEIEINENAKHGIELITILDEKFPSKLYTISDPILYLYYKGNIELINKPAIAIIGTRNPSLESVNNTNKLSWNLSKLKYVIVSGLALGIDTIAHKGCLEAKGNTIAVLPSGIDNIQPMSNRILAKQIIESDGCLITEYSVNTTLNKFNYAKRDRIQSALSNVVIVPQANEKSGTMIAVNKSKKEKKPIFQLSTNNNKLIDNIININDPNYLKIIQNSVELDIKNEKQKIDKLKSSVKDNKQISLFDT